MSAARVATGWGRAEARAVPAVGYGGTATASGVRVVPLRPADGTLSRPTREAAMAGTYPLARPLYVYVLAVAPEPVLRFVDWMTSWEAQSLAERAGFFPSGGA